MNYDKYKINLILTFNLLVQYLLPASSSSSLFVRFTRRRQIQRGPRTNHTHTPPRYSTRLISKCLKKLTRDLLRYYYVFFNSMSYQFFFLFLLVFLYKVFAFAFFFQHEILLRHLLLSRRIIIGLNVPKTVLLY